MEHFLKTICKDLFIELEGTATVVVTQHVHWQIADVDVHGESVQGI